MSTYLNGLISGNALHVFVYFDRHGIKKALSFHPEVENNNVRPKPSEGSEFQHDSGKMILFYEICSQIYMTHE